MALEGVGYGHWEGGMQDIPVTAKAEERLPQVVLDDDEDAEEPVLRYPRNSKDGDVSEGGMRRRASRSRQVTKDELEKSDDSIER